MCGRVDSVCTSYRCISSIYLCLESVCVCSICVYSIGEWYIELELVNCSVVLYRNKLTQDKLLDNCLNITSHHFKKLCFVASRKFVVKNIPKFIVIDFQIQYFSFRFHLRADTLLCFTVNILLSKTCPYQIFRSCHMLDTSRSQNETRTVEITKSKF